MASTLVLEQYETKSTNRPPDLWDKALLKVEEKNLTIIKPLGGSRRQILEEVLRLVQNTEVKARQKKWKWKNRKGETIIIQDVFAKMVVWVDKVKSIGDTIVQYDPGHAALPWAAARLLLQAMVNDVQINGAMLEGLELVFNLIAKYEVVEELYLYRQSSLQDRLSDAITALYTSILEFLFTAQHYFHQRTLSRIAKSLFHFEERTLKSISKIKRMSLDVEEYTRLMLGEIVSNTDDTLGKILSRIQDLPIRAHNTTNISSVSYSVEQLPEPSIKYLSGVLQEFNEPIIRVATRLSAIEDNLEELERLKVFEWLSNVEYRSHHRSKVKTLLPASGEWLLRKSEFKQWMGTSSSSILWLHGIPGSGKSMLVAQVVEYIESKYETQSSPAPIAYFYCARSANEPERSDPTEILRSILEQLSCTDESVPIRVPVSRAYLERKKMARGRKPERLDLEEVLEVLLLLLEDNPATILIDGLDECDPAKRHELLESHRTLLRKSPSIVKIFVSSRDDHDLVHRLSQTPNIYIHSADNEVDIRSFVKTRVREAIVKERILCGVVSNRLRKEIVDTLIKKASGMFRLVSLHIDQLCNPRRIKTEENVRDALDKLPMDLSRSYDSIMAQIRDSQYPNPILAERVLKCMSCSSATPVLLYQVVADLPDQNPPSISDVLRICCNLVIFDDDLEQFRFAHLSVWEYLETLPGYSWSETNMLAAEQCLSWILSSRRRTRSDRQTNTISWLDKGKHDFTDYADLYWPYHTENSSFRVTEGSLSKLLEAFFLGPRDNHNCTQHFTAWEQRLDGASQRTQDSMIKDHHSDWKPYRLSSPSNPVFLACVLALDHIVSKLVKDSSDVLARNQLSLTPIQVATRFYSVETVSVIITKANSEKWSLPPRFWHEAIVSAAINSSTLSLEALFESVGSGFVDLADLQDLAMKADTSKMRERLLHTVNLVLSNNMTLALRSGNILDPIFQRIGGLNIARQFFDVIYSTMDHDIVTIRGRSSDWWTDNLSMAGEAIRRRATTKLAEIFRSIVGRIYWSISDPRTKFSNTSKLFSDAPEKLLNLDGFSPPSTDRKMTTLQVLYYCAGILYPLLTISPNSELYKLLCRRLEEEFKLSWQDLLKLKDVEGSHTFIILLLRRKPVLDTTAVIALICHWDEIVVGVLLEYQKIEVTGKIINAAARNIKHGAAILKLLLEKEMEDQIP